MNCTKASERYYLSLKPRHDEVHPVHREGCPFMPDDENRLYLGRFSSGIEAGMEGRKIIAGSCGCRFCSDDSSGKQVARQLNTNLFPTESQLASAGQRILCFLN